MKIKKQSKTKIERLYRFISDRELLSKEKMSKPAAQAISQSLKDLKNLVQETKDATITNKDILTNMLTTMVALESRIAELEITSKNAGTKRPVKTESSSTTANTAPTGKKFPGSSFVWFGQLFKDTPDEIIAQYFTEEHKTQVDAKLEADPKYKADLVKYEETSDDSNKKSQLKRTLLGHKCRAYWGIVRDAANSNLKNKINQDYDAKKAEYSKENQTPAKKDEDASE